VTGIRGSTGVIRIERFPAQHRLHGRYLVFADRVLEAFYSRDRTVVEVAKRPSNDVLKYRDFVRATMRRESGDGEAVECE